MWLRWFLFFFFSSRRRHTRWNCDWSSDVCSSDLLPGDTEQDLTVLINPVIEPVGSERALGWEGCLSVPGLRGVVPRDLYIRYRGHGLDGAVFERAAAGFHARVV